MGNESSGNYMHFRGMPCRFLDSCMKLLPFLVFDLHWQCLTSSTKVPACLAFRTPAANVPMARFYIGNGGYPAGAIEKNPVQKISAESFDIS
jgi:hypothetical protein